MWWWWQVKIEGKDSIGMMAERNLHEHSVRLQLPFCSKELDMRPTHLDILFIKFAKILRISTCEYSAISTHSPYDHVDLSGRYWCPSQSRRLFRRLFTSTVTCYLYFTLYNTGFKGHSCLFHLFHYHCWNWSNQINTRNEQFCLVLAILSYKTWMLGGDVWIKGKKRGRHKLQV